jgi:hypothetical protein
LPDWLLGGQRLAALETDGRTPLGYRSDAARLSVGTSHDRRQDAAWPHESANVSPTDRRLHPHWNFVRMLDVGVLADPARRTLVSRLLCRVCGAAKAYRLHVAVRGCALLATESLERPAVAARSVKYEDGAMSERQTLIMLPFASDQKHEVMPTMLSCIRVEGADLA